MAFGSAPDVNGNASVGAICVATCSQRSPVVLPNPNGEYPGVVGGSSGGGTGGFGGAGGAQGNGSGGSPGGGWPPPDCEGCPECRRCSTG